MHRVFFFTPFWILLPLVTPSSRSLFSLLPWHLTLSVVMTLYGQFLLGLLQGTPCCLPVKFGHSFHLKQSIFLILYALSPGCSNPFSLYQLSSIYQWLLNRISGPDFSPKLPTYVWRWTAVFSSLHTSESIWNEESFSSPSSFSSLSLSPVKF